MLGSYHLPDPQGDGARGQSHEREPAEDDHGIEYFAKLDANEGDKNGGSPHRAGSLIRLALARKPAP